MGSWLVKVTEEKVGIVVIGAGCVRGLGRRRGWEDGKMRGAGWPRAREGGSISPDDLGDWESPLSQIRARQTRP